MYLKYFRIFSVKRQYISFISLIILKIENTIQKSKWDKVPYLRIRIGGKNGTGN